METIEITLFDVEYIVSRNGEVLNKETNAPPPIYKTSQKGKGKRTMIVMDYDAVVNIDYGLFLLHSFNKFFLPFELWNEASVGFLDDDVENYDLANLYVTHHNGAVPFDALDGFYYVPGMELNAINERGLLYRIPQSDILFPVFEKNEKYSKLIYPHYRINISSTSVLTRDVHRLLAITFKGVGVKYPIMEVNHLNGEKQDFSLNNLEWTTPSENNIHAFENGMRGDNKAVQVKDMTSGVVRTFYSLGEAARNLGGSVGGISSVITGKTRTYLGRYLVKELIDDRTWEELESLTPLGLTNGVKARNVHTGEVIAFKSVREACTKLGVHSSAVLSQINSSKPKRLILNNHEFKRKDDHSSWKNFDEYELEVSRRGLPNNTPVYKIIHLESGEEETVYGWRDVSKLTGVVKRTVLVVAKRGGVIGGKYKVIKLK